MGSDILLHEGRNIALNHNYIISLKTYGGNKMKKLLVCLFATTLLFGCGSKDAGKNESKTCTFSQAGIEIAAQMNAVDDKIKSVKMDVSAPASMMAGVDLSTLTDEDKKTVESQVLKSLAVEEGQGIEVSSKFTKEAMNITVDIDLEKGSADALTAIGFTEIKDMSLADFVKQAESSNATCK